MTVWPHCWPLWSRDSGVRRRGRQLFSRSEILTFLKARCSVRQKEEQFTIFVPVVAVPILYHLIPLYAWQDFSLRVFTSMASSLKW